MTKLYDDLGVAPDATAAEIKAAHRRAAKRHHPDAGGDREQFERISHAAMILCDPARRARYDETGDQETAPDNELAKLSEAMNLAFGKAVQEAVAADNFSYQDIIARAQQMLRSDQRVMDINIRKMEDQIALSEKIMKRLRFKGKGHDFIGATVRGHIAGLNRGIEKARAEIEFMKKAEKALGEYRWQVDQRPVMQSQTTAAPWTNVLHA